MSGRNRLSFKQTLELMADRNVRQVTLTRRQQRELATSVLRAMEIISNKTDPPKILPLREEIARLKTKLSIVHDDHRAALNALNRANTIIERIVRIGKGE